MLPRHHQLKFAPRRALTALRRLQREIWQPLETGTVALVAPDGSRQELTLPYFWGKLYEPQNFSIGLPTSANDGSLWMRWRDQAESTLYVDGKPYFGFDIGHRECLLPPEFTSLEMRSQCIQSAIWHPDATGVDSLGSRLEGVTFLRRSELHWKTYHDFVVLNELLKVVALRDAPENHLWFQEKGVMPETHHLSPLTRRLLRDVDDASDLIDRKDIEGLSCFLDHALARLPSEPWNLDATITGHSHIDLVWMWPEAIGESKAVHTFTNVDYLMERYPEFRFGYSQPASYEAVKRHDAELFDRVSGRIKAGRWEALGALYVESDTLTPCGEALARSFEVGQAGFTELTGKPSPTLWLPDVFGYSGVLPQLMKLYGVKYFFTNKLTWNDTATFPHTSFRWVGNDGSEVLTHIHPETVQFYNGYGSVEEIDRAQRKSLQSDTHREMLIPTGFGDGGGGPTEEMCERMRRFKNFATLPRCEWGTIQGFFERLDLIRPELPEHFGEMLLQFHRGTFSSQSHFKSLYRNLEVALQRAEFVAALNGLPPLNPQWWKRLVFSQFHDVLPGSSIHSAYLALHEEFHAIMASIESYLTDTLDNQEPAQFLNCTPFDQRVWAQDRLLEIPAYQNRSISEAIPPDLPAIIVTESCLRTPDWDAEFNSCGEIESLRFNGRAVPTTAPLNQISLYPNVPHSFPAWDVDRQALSLGEHQGQLAKISIERIHEGRVSLSFARPIGRQSHLTVTYHADLLKPFLQISYDFDWQEETTLAKAVFPTRYQGDSARFAQPFGSAIRRQNPRHAVDEAYWEMPASRWALVSDDGEREGLAVITENKYAFSNRHGTLGVTLLTSPVITGEGPDNAQAFPPTLRDDIPDSIYADIGTHRFDLILAPWDANDTPRKCYPAALADYAFQSPLATGSQSRALPVQGLTGSKSVYISWIQPQTNGAFIVKTVESMGHRGSASLELLAGFSATPIDGLKNRLGTTLVDGRFEVGPYELHNFLITPSASGKSPT